MRKLYLNFALLFTFGIATAQTSSVTLNATAQNITKDSAALLYDYQLSDDLAGADVKVKMGYLPDGEGGGTDLWKNANVNIDTWFATGADWKQVDGPAIENLENGYRLTGINAGATKWQGQVKFQSDFATSSEKKYNFSMTVTPSVALPSLTVKLTGVNQDDIFYSEEEVYVEAGKPTVISYKELADRRIQQFQIVLDFHGTAQNASCDITDIQFVEITGPAPGTEFKGYDYFDDANLLKGLARKAVRNYYGPDGLTFTGDDAPTVDQAEDGYTITVNRVPTMVSAWMANVRMEFGPKNPDDPYDYLTFWDKTYDFSVTITASNNLNNVDILGGAAEMFLKTGLSLTKDTPKVIHLTDMGKDQGDGFRFSLNTPNAPSGTVISVSQPVLREHTDDPTATFNTVNECPIVITGLKPETEYSYTFVAIATKGEEVVKSDLVTVTFTTLKDESGIATVEATEDAPAVYYNLMGIPVANPAPGNIYIRKQDHKAEKVLVR